jgi:hypothetical protein
MPKFKAKADRNQPEIVKALRDAKASVQHLHAVGAGCPDILVCFRNVLYLMEIKDGSKPPSQRKLTPDQVKWHENWCGDVHVVKSVDEALAVIGLHHGLVNIPLVGTIK